MSKATKIINKTIELAKGECGSHPMIHRAIVTNLETLKQLTDWHKFEDEPVHEIDYGDVRKKYLVKNIKHYAFNFKIEAVCFFSEDLNQWILTAGGGHFNPAGTYFKELEI